MNEPTRALVMMISILVVVFLLVPLLWGGTMMGPGMMGRWGGPVQPWSPLASAFWLVIVVGLGMVVFWAARHQELGSGQSPDLPLEILKRRYARGELTREQFEQMRSSLEGAGSS